jgi:hypothetical protein
MDREGEGETRSGLFCADPKLLLSTEAGLPQIISDTLVSVKSEAKNPDKLHSMFGQLIHILVACIFS